MYRELKSIIENIEKDYYDIIDHSELVDDLKTAIDNLEDTIAEELNG